MRHQKYPPQIIEKEIAIRFAKFIFDYEAKHGQRSGIQKRLATRLKVSEATVSMWREKAVIPAKYLPEIANFFGVPLDWLMGIPDAKSTEELQALHDEQQLIENLRKALWSEDDIIQAEATSKVTWVATPDLQWDYLNTTWRDRILRNIVSLTQPYERYCLIYPLTGDNPDNVRWLEDELQRRKPDDWRNHIHYLGIKEEEFAWYVEHVLYNPFSSSRRCIMVTNYSEWGIGSDFNFEISQSATTKFVKYFKHIWNTNIKEEDKGLWMITDNGFQSNNS